MGKGEGDYHDLYPQVRILYASDRQIIPEKEEYRVCNA